MTSAFEQGTVKGSLLALPGRSRPMSTLLPTLTSFLGREPEIEEVAALLDHDETRIVTLTGPGGVGKTRLAMEVAGRLAGDYVDGVCLVRLASIRDPDLVPAAVGRVTGAQDRGQRSAVDALVAELNDRHLLLVLDNFEHLLAQPPVWLADLLTRCPRLKVLVTSRVKLNIGGEHRYVVAPMAVPVAGDTASPTDAVTLFEHRATAARSSFALTDANTEMVGEICRRLDGLPLAIELAAARVSALTPTQISDRLSDRFQLLSGGQSDAPARLQSMHDAVAWSFDLLSPEEQRLFQRLSVFVGGFTLEAAEHVVDGETLDALTGVASLVDKSLLRLVDEPGAEPRYLMLETIREFGLERLEASGDTQDARERHARWCRTLTTAMMNGEEGPLWRPDPAGIERLDREYGNLQSAIQWLADNAGIDGETELVVALGWFWYLTRRLSEGLGWCERAIQRNGPAATGTRIDALRWAGVLAQTLNEPRAGSYLADAVDLAQRSNDTWREVQGLFQLGVLAEDDGDFDEAAALLQRALQIGDLPSHGWMRLIIDYHRGVVMQGAGQLDQARATLDAVKSTAETSGDWLVVAWVSAHLALIACDQKHPRRAVALLRPLAGEQGADRRAAHPQFLGCAGVVACAVSRYVQSARFFGAAARAELLPKYPERAIFERAEHAARRHLGEDAYRHAWNTGWSMRDDRIGAELRLLLADDTASASPVAPAAIPETGLTRREMDVLRLMADGLSNQQIADSLFNSRKTVEFHVANILGKLGVESRTAAVSFAFRNFLV